MLNIKNLRKSYTTGTFTQIALDDVTLSFRENEFVSILGPSVSGKTTFLNIIGGLDRYDSGNLIINGKETKFFKDNDWDAYRNNSIGFIFQSYNLINHLSIIDNVEMGMTLSGIDAKIKKEKAISVLTRVGLKDHMHKKPNQLSGGQMQRVAIARALANDPDIILADEPTGALDTKTSIQIMELIKEIAIDKLVIMVTHNPSLATEYSDRVVSFKDGKVIDDTNPFTANNEPTNYTLKKTSMSFFTALKLSYKNICTKKGRTALTAIASSIGIIGIAIILSLSNGFKKQIDTFESNTLYNFPIIIAPSAQDLDAMLYEGDEVINLDPKAEEMPKDNKIVGFNPNTNSNIHNNKLNDEYFNYISKIDQKLIDGVAYTRKLQINLLYKGDTIKQVDAQKVGFNALPDSNNNEPKYIEKNYDLLEGTYPKEATDLVLIIDKNNRLDYKDINELGFNIKPTEKIDIKDVVGREYKIASNNDFYKEAGPVFVPNITQEELSTTYNSNNSISVKIVGVVRAKEEVKMEILPTGIAFSNKLQDLMLVNAKDSNIVKAQLDADYNVFDGKKFTKVTNEYEAAGSMQEQMWSHGTQQQQALSKDDILVAIGAKDIPQITSIYPADFESKDNVIEYLDAYNKDKDKADKILYQDQAKMMADMSGSIMDGITMVLVAFASVSLVVSLIMIGIITYISVLERTKEIGVLRALGARKKDITRVFNAETFIVGSLSGLLGILIAYLCTFPINAIIYFGTELENVAQLDPVHAITLVVLSVSLTVLGGLLPARYASKKDPVESLRSE
ncbi:MAG: ATP-binding cassette domain-containing protein [Erysipelotrichaceae bacterium]